MSGSVLVPFSEDRDVFIDTQRCGRTNVPFEVQVGTHDIDLGDPVNYTPLSQKIQVKAQSSSLNPLVVNFTPTEEAGENE